MNAILGRVLQMLLTIVVSATLVFALGRITGDPVALLVPMDTPAERYEEVKHGMGLDRPLVVQYVEFLGQIAQGDLGQSVRLRRPVVDIIAEALPRSLALGSVSMALAVLLGVPLGVLAAIKHGSIWDTVARILALLGQGAPSFLLGIFLIIVFSVWLRVLPATGSDGPANYIMPAFTIAWFIGAGVVRLLRSSMLEILGNEYIRTARAKGLSERIVISVHALKNAAIPLVTFIGMMLGVIVGASVAVEVVFAWPGIGRAAFESVIQRDFPLIQGIVIVLTLLVLVVNMVVDALYPLLDPRLRYGRGPAETK